MTRLEKEYHHLSLWYFVSFIYGIIFFFYINNNYSIYSLLFGVVCLAFLVKLFHKKKLLLWFFITSCCLTFFSGIVVGELRVSNIHTQPIDKPIISKLSGKVKQVKPTLHGAQIILQDVHLANNIKLNTLRVNVASKLIADVTHGDTVQLKAKLFPLQQSVLPGTYDFGFYMYMSGIEATGYALTTLKVTDSNKSFLQQNVQIFRRNIYDRLISGLGNEQGNFAAAILIGETKAIPKQIAENMRNSGVAHILSVCGLHLSLVAMIFFVTSRMLLNCSNYLAYNFNIKIIAAVISIIGSFAYLQISGSNIAATRAFIMTSIFIISIMLGRSAYPLRSVMIAACLILMVYPEYVFHPSFQLSFSAVLCLISGYEFYLKNKHFLGLSKGVFASIKFYIFANIYSSFLASIVTAPFVIYHFYKFATYSVFMNLIAVPLMSFFMMPLALLFMILAPFTSGEWVLNILGWFIDIITYSAAYIVNLPGAVWVTGNISSASLLVFTFGFFWICIWQTAWRFLGMGIMFVALIMMFLAEKPDFIYDHNLKAVGVRNNYQELEIHVEHALPIFTADYWANWYGQSSIKTVEEKIVATDQLFVLPSGKTISLNYWKCLDADVQIITSSRLQCSGNEQIIYNTELWKYKQILLYCSNKGKQCRIEYAPLKT
ncbi:MAG: ComEC family competence protein [Rickettsiaceae bacterium]|nr:ComEC family competence protein [Rickettsiaceae bacterium]